MAADGEIGLFERTVLNPLVVLYMSSQSFDVRAGSLKILLHVLEVVLFSLGTLLVSITVMLLNLI